MGTVMRHVGVPFAGAGAGTAPMTWAQLGIWKTMVRTGINMNIGGTVPMPPGTTVEEMQTLLRYLVTRHQSLRTRLRFTPDGAAEQVLSAAGEITLALIDAEDPAAAAEEVRARWAAEPFDYEREWPLRMAVVLDGGSVTHVVLMYCHLAVDGFGIEAIVRDMANLDRATGEPTAPVAALTPFELAQKQASPAGRRAGEKSLRHWEHVLRGIPARRLGGSGDPRTPRYWELTLHSPALHRALPEVTRRTGVGPGYLLLAAYAMALFRRTGRNPSVAQLVVSNRFRPGCGDSVSQLAQLGVCAIDVAGVDFDEAARRAFTAATSAFMHGYYDPTGLDAVVARVREERPDLEYDIIVNDRMGVLGAPEADPPRTPAAPTTVRWNRKIDALDAVLNISFDAAPDAVDVTIGADTHRLAPADIEALAREIEHVTICSAAPVENAGASSTQG
jgi:hypothetical protein